MKVEIQKKDDYLVVTVIGNYDLNEAIKKFPLVITACRQTGLTKALIDYRDLEGDIPTTLDFLYTLQVIELYKAHRSAGGPPIRFAFVGANPKPWPMGEEMGQRHGVEVLLTYHYLNLR